MTRFATALGILAIVLWSSTIAFSRQAAQALGPLTSAAVIFIAGGLLACVQVSFHKPGLKAILRLPRRYLLGCGALFMSYEVALYLAVGLSASDQQVLVVGLINYLWPALILVTAIPLLGYRASPWLAAGVLLALMGIILARSGNGLAWALASGEAWLPYLLMLYGALAWALYTNLSRRWLGENALSGLPLFILATGILLGWMRLFVVESSHWSWAAGLSVSYLVIGVTWMAYTFWDIGSRRGNLILLGTLSYFIPLISTGISVIVLGEPARPTLWLAALLLIAGAWVCKRSVQAHG
jgi:drug/metabolite transporter (DMT)-like permease